VDKKGNDKLTITAVTDSGFRKFDMETEDGTVNIVRGYYQYDQNGQIQNESVVSYPADLWQYTEEGYLLFGGSYFSDENFVLTLSNAREYTALRILPLNETCRELNRKYILSAGYRRNNMFLTDWSEEDFGGLNFYDIFDIFYPLLYKQPVPYVLNENSGAGTVFKIPEEIFENVIMTYFEIDKETLRRETTYLQEDAAYEYRPRGFSEAEYPDIPYPEVVSYTENEDGTITLMVNAVYPNGSTSKAFSHRTVIRPISEERFQYVSNQTVSIEDGNDIWWHSERLSEEEWNEIYKPEERTEKGYDLPVDADQRKEAEDDCKRMMEFIRGIYEQADKGDASNVVLSDNTLSAMQDKLKETRNPVITMGAYPVVENFGSVDNFLHKCTEGVSGSVVVYKLRSDGGIGRMKFIFDGSDMYVLSAAAAWNKENEPKVASISYNRIEEWKYTEKGWFCYKLCVPEYPEVTEIVDGSCLIRVKPMTEENREMSEKCVLRPAYQGNNLLCSDWDTEHMEDLDYNGLYEYFYEMKYQERFQPEDYPNGIPKEDFEKLMMEYLPVTEEEIQKYAIFDRENQTYAWEKLRCSNYTPSFFDTSVPEVTHIRENEDGTVTLTVDAVCQMVLCDDAVITHELTVRFSEDGSFQYLGNKILDNTDLLISAALLPEALVSF